VKPLSIELRLSEVEPPKPDEPRTMYRDLANLPDPMQLGLTIKAYNYDDVGLYFQITGNHPDYTFQTVNLGLIGSGANITSNLDNFASRSRPVAETEEVITLILRAYTDAGHSDLKWTYNRSVTVIIISSQDGSWTTDVDNNFDDGTVQGWNFTQEFGTPVGSIGVATDYVLSAPYSLRMTCPLGSGTTEWRGRYDKSFTTPDRTNVFAIIEMRVAKSDIDYINRIQVTRAGTLLIHLGRDDLALSDYVPIGKWVRAVVPLPRNTTIEVRIIVRRYRTVTPTTNGYSWLDDFKIISKD